jgi:hypothetical protein
MIDLSILQRSLGIEGPDSQTRQEARESFAIGGRVADLPSPYLQLAKCRSTGTDRSSSVANPMKALADG